MADSCFFAVENMNQITARNDTKASMANNKQMADGFTSELNEPGQKPLDTGHG